MCQICANLRPYDKSCALSEFSGSTVDILRATLREGGDAPDGRATPYRMQMGDVFNGTIGTPGDSDWVAIRLNAGQTYQFEQKGIGLSDPYLELRNARGDLVSSNDDGGNGLNSRIVINPSQSGTYYLNALAYSSETGSYQLTARVVQAPQPASLSDMATYLTNGYWNDTGQSARSFDTSADNIITYDMTGLDSAGRALARDAMQAWSSVADIQFREQRGSADISFDDNDFGAYAQSTTIGDDIVRSSVNVDQDWLAQYGWRIGSYSFQTYVHEVGHALGLGHQGNYNGSASFGGDEFFPNDSWQASVMSYFSQEDNFYVDASRAYVATLMPADILAIQRLYGAAGSGSLTAGNTVYGVGHTLGDSWLGRVFSAQNGGNQQSVQGARDVAMTISDAGGFDVLNFRNDTNAQRVDLRMGMASDIFGLQGNLQMAHNTVIEGYIAGYGNDAVNGNFAGNVLRGMAGNDRLAGLYGNDILHGGTGFDTLYGGAGNDRLFGNQGNDHLMDLSGNNAMSGGYGHDLLSAGVGRDTLYGNAGNDRLFGGGGDDIIFGNQDHDEIRAGWGSDRAEGGIGNDIVDGGAGNDRLYGQQGNDIMVGGWGSDSMSGGQGRDVFRFFTANDSTLRQSDLIIDFRPDQDVLDLRMLDLNYVGNRGFSNTPSVRWDYMNNMTRIIVDSDGDGQADMFIRLSGRLDIDADSFLL